MNYITSLPEAEPLDGLEIVECSQLSPTVTISATTISAVASDNSYNDSANGFIAAGFAVNDRVYVEGFTGNVVNNIFVGMITALTTGKMTIGGTDGDVIVDDAAGETVVITKWESVRLALTDLPKQLESFVLACSDETTALTAGLAKVTFRMPYAFTVTAVYASLTTAQATNGAGGIFTVDINEGGTSILSTKLTIDNTEDDSDTATTPAVISDASLAHRAKITVDIDQIGDGTAKGLKVTLVGRRT